MRILSKKEIQKIAADILAKHGASGATLTVTDKGGGTSMGQLNTTLSAPQKNETPLGGTGETPKIPKAGGGNVGLPKI
jgi:hypothetical protein